MIYINLYIFIRYDTFNSIDTYKYDKYFHSFPPTNSKEEVIAIH